MTCLSKLADLRVLQEVLARHVLSTSCQGRSDQVRNRPVFCQRHFKDSRTDDIIKGLQQTVAFVKVCKIFHC